MRRTRNQSRPNTRSVTQPRAKILKAEKVNHWPWTLTVLFAALIALAMAATSVRAGETWDDMKPDVFDDRPILDGSDFLVIDAPRRPEDQRSVPVRVRARLNDGRTIKSVTMVVDENPMPVAAVFDIGGARSSIDLGVSFRLSRKTDIRAIVEVSDGTLYMVHRFVKYAGGQSACSAPPEGDPKEILANMGKMKLNHKRTKVAASQVRPKASLELSHPNHTGMVLDQITLLYLPMRMVSKIDVRQGDEKVFSMTGSITIAQNPAIDFDYHANGAQTLVVDVEDTDDTSWTKSFPINQGS